jgi:tetratricopeptide (TPR) repeat protein
MYYINCTKELTWGNVLKMTSDRPESGQILDLATNLMDNALFTDAISELERAASIDPKNRLIWERVVICNLELKRPKKALEAMDSILTLEPNAHKVWAEKAYLHLLLQEETEGMKALLNSIRLNPRNQRDWFLLGSVYMTMELWDDSRDAFHVALQLNPNDAETWYNLATVNYMIGDVGAALGAAEQATSIDPEIDKLSDDWLDDLRSEYDIFEIDDDSDVADDLAAGS